MSSSDAEANRGTNVSGGAAAPTVNNSAPPPSDNSGAGDISPGSGRDQHSRKDSDSLSHEEDDFTPIVIDDEEGFQSKETLKRGSRRQDSRSKGPRGGRSKSRAQSHDEYPPLTNAGGGKRRLSTTPTSSQQSKDKLSRQKSPIGQSKGPAGASINSFVIPKVRDEKKNEEKKEKREQVLKAKYGKDYQPPGPSRPPPPPKSMLTTAAKAGQGQGQDQGQIKKSAPQSGAKGGTPKGPPAPDKVSDVEFVNRALMDKLSIMTMEPSQRQLDLLRYGEETFAAIAAGKKQKRVDLPHLLFVNKGTELRLGITEKEFEELAEFIAAEQLKEILSTNPNKIICDNEYHGTAQHDKFRVISGVFGCKDLATQQWMIQKIAEFRTPAKPATKTSVFVPRGTFQAFRAYKKGEHGKGRLMALLVRKALHKYSEEQLVQVIRACNPLLEGELLFSSWYSVMHGEAKAVIFICDNNFVAGVKLAEARISLGISRESAVFM